MEDNKRVERTWKDEALGVLVSGFGIVFFTIIFRSYYLLASEPVYGTADIVDISPFSLTYRFYAKSTNKTYTIQKDVLRNVSEKFNGRKTINIVYPQSMPEYVQVPELNRPLPVILPIIIHLLTAWAFVASIRDFVKLWYARDI